MKPIIVDVDINSSKVKVWNAITNVDEMKQWFFDNIPDFKTDVGFKTWFVIKNEERIFYHLWEVVEVDVFNMIKVEWTYPSYIKKPFFVTFYITELKDNLTNFKVIAEGLEMFEQFSIPEFTRESCIGGWNYFTNKLKSNLEK